MRLLAVALLAILAGTSNAEEIFFCDVSTKTLNPEYERCLQDKNGTPDQCKQLICAAAVLESQFAVRDQ